MKNIAVLSCGKVDCTFGGCLNAFYDRKKAFEPYQDQELRMVAMMRCPECFRESGADPMASESFLGKRMAEAFEEKGVKVVWGTH